MSSVSCHWNRDAFVNPSLDVKRVIQTFPREDGIEGIVASSLAGADNQSLTVVELGDIRL